MGISRRSFLAGTALGTAGLALGLHALRPRRGPEHPRPVRSPARTVSYRDWSDVYRASWKWDRVARGSHNRANCFSACSWNLFVRDGIVWHEEQNAPYDAPREGLPDFNPRGCQKGACHSDLEQGEARVLHPLRRVGERGEGKWRRISWDEAYDEIADACIDAALAAGTETIVHDHGTTNIDYGPDAASEMRWILAMGATLIDSWAGVGDMPNGVVQTQGIFMVDGTTDDWFLSDYIVIWMANPAYTRIPDVHFVHEARYRGAKLVVVSPDLWISPRAPSTRISGSTSSRRRMPPSLWRRSTSSSRKDSSRRARSGSRRTSPSWFARTTVATCGNRICIGAAGKISSTSGTRPETSWPRPPAARETTPTGSRWAHSSPPSTAAGPWSWRMARVHGSAPSSRCCGTT
jgi:hypothetical protein